jgi:hypothetical protein
VPRRGQTLERHDGRGSTDVQALERLLDRATHARQIARAAVPAGQPRCPFELGLVRHLLRMMEALDARAGRDGGVGGEGERCRGVVRGCKGGAVCVEDGEISEKYTR